MQNEKYGFVYLWYDRKHQRYYIGSHWGDEDDGYICSSRWMRKAFRRRPNDFKRRIISRIYTNRHDLLTEEQRWLHMIKPEQIGKRYYNLNTFALFNAWWTDPNRAKTVRERMSRANLGKRSSPETEIKPGQRKSVKTEFKKGVSPHNKGKMTPEEVRQKQSQSHKGKRISPDTEFKKGQPSWNAGVPCREETKQKLREAAKRRWELINKGRIEENSHGKT